MLKEDLGKFEAGARGLVRVELEQHQFDALVSFAYDCGLGLRRVLSGCCRVPDRNERIMPSHSK